MSSVKVFQKRLKFIAEAGWKSMWTPRIFTTIPIVILIYRAGIDLQSSFGISTFLMLLSELVSCVLIWTNRDPIKMDLSFLSLFSTGFASFYFLFFALEPALSSASILLFQIGGALQILGLSLQLSGKVFLGRSFGLVPANRGIVVSGPYRWIRHPIYGGYLINHVGFLLRFPSVYNASLYLLLYAAQIIRIQLEENLLSKDSSYVEYMRKTKYKFIPFVW